MNAFEKKIAIEGGCIREHGENRFRSAFIGEPVLFIPALAVVALIIWRGVHQAAAWYWIVTPCVLVFFAGCGVAWRFTLEPSKGVIRKQAFWFTRWLLKEQSISFRDIKWVFVERGSHDGEIAFGVFLQPRVGRKIPLKYYHTPRPAEELAWRISCETGIKLIESNLNEQTIT